MFLAYVVLKQFWKDIHLQSYQHPFRASHGSDFFTLVCVSVENFSVLCSEVCILWTKPEESTDRGSERHTERQRQRDPDRLTAAAAAKTSIISIIINTLVTILLQTWKGFDMDSVINAFKSSSTTELSDRLNEFNTKVRINLFTKEDNAHWSSFNRMLKPWVWKTI